MLPEIFEASTPPGVESVAIDVHDPLLTSESPVTVGMPCTPSAADTASPEAIDAVVIVGAVPDPDVDRPELASTDATLPLVVVAQCPRRHTFATTDVDPNEIETVSTPLTSAVRIRATHVSVVTPSFATPPGVRFTNAPGTFDHVLPCVSVTPVIGETPDAPALSHSMVSCASAPTGTSETCTATDCE